MPVYDDIQEPDEVAQMKDLGGAASDPEQVKQLGDQLGRLVFGE